MVKEIEILLVDDEVLFAILLKKKLKQSGYKIIRHVTTGEKAVSSASREKPDLILMDIRLAGDIDGIEAAKKIKNSENIPIIFITGYDSTVLRNKAMEIQPLDYLVKPVSMERLEKTLNSHFSLS